MSILTECFRRQAKTAPEKTAVICDMESLSYQELYAQVSVFAQVFEQTGMKAEDKLGVLLPNGIDFVCVMLAAAHLGIGLVPLNPTSPVKAVAAAFAAAGVRHVIGGAAALNGLGEVEGVDGARLVLGTGRENGHCILFRKMAEKIVPGELESRGDFDDLPYIFTMTSGSTGEPKPIVLTQRNKYLRARAAQELYGVTAADRTLAATPLYHSLAERLVLLPLLTGGTSVIMVHFSASAWIRCVSEQRISFSIAVSSQLSQIARVLTSPFLPDIGCLRCIVSSSALLETHVKKELLSKLKCDFHECYGTSEVAIVSDLDHQSALRKTNSVGRAIPGVEIRIMREDGTVAGPGEPGEIICRTPMLFAGYYRLPAKTAEAVRDGFFHTGDAGYLDEEGFLYFLSRRKDIIITGGINVYPGDVEAEVLKLPGVLECAAFPLPDERLGETVAVAVVMKPGVSFDCRSARFHCAENMADFQIPRNFFVVEELPRNAMGKLTKHKLSERFAALADRGVMECRQKL